MRKGRKGRNKEMKKEEEGRGSKEGGKMVRSERNRKIKMEMIRLGKTSFWHKTPAT